MQLSSISSLELRLLDMQALIAALCNDSDLAIPESLSPLAMQVVYICSGCDFFSFFNGLGKASYLSTFFEYCGFICSSSDHAPGMLTDTYSSTPGFLLFIRIVGCAYFRKHKSAFLPAYSSPIALFSSFTKEDETVLDHRTTWLNLLRKRIWSKIKYEEEMISSSDALKRHWMRLCWVVSVWRQARDNYITYPPIEGNGWKQPDVNTLLISVMKTLPRSTGALIKKGCGCNTGCISARCKCKKAGKYCGLECKSVRCCNLPSDTCTCTSQNLHKMRLGRVAVIQRMT